MLDQISPKKNFIETPEAIFIFEIFSKESIHHKEQTLKMEKIYLSTIFFKIKLPDSHISIDKKSLPIPPHLYYSLCRTPLGFRFLVNKGEIERFSETVKKFCLLENNVKNEEDNKNGKFDFYFYREKILKIVSDLWTIGNICRTEEGFAEFKKNGILEQISRLAKNSQELSIKSCCVSVLGMIASADKMYFGKLGWSFPFNDKIQVVIPANIEEFFDLKNTEKTFKNGEKIENLSKSLNDLISELNKEETKIFFQISKFSSTNNTLKVLTNFKQYHSKNKDIFKSVKLFAAVTKLLNLNKFDLILRRSILFDFFKEVSLNSDFFKLI
ncbi:hypothetical protein MHBO_002902 [Bonamia ostreae]|uniref:Rapamycin-insensitive companion of mTOR domain-containing protein n=1 Tax=Bonamia ostreae TaxID=126728 RepID=A0ABV2APN7_9EUKA